MSQSIAQKIVDAINQTGNRTSLFRLTLDLGINYSHAHHVVTQLHDSGDLLVTRTNGQGRPLCLQLPHRGVIESAQNARHKAQGASGVDHA